MKRNHTLVNDAVNAASEEPGLLPGLLGLFGFKQKAKPDPFPEETAIAMAELKVRQNRRLAKMMAKVGRPPRADGWPGGRKWAPRRTGQPDWFKSMKHAADRQRFLIKIPTSSLVPEFKNARQFQDAYPNLWVLSQARYEDLLALPGVGPAKLKDLRAFLSKKNVACKWRAA